MKKLACSAVSGDIECNFVATGDTDEEVMSQLKQHGKEAHGMTEEDITEETMKKMKENIKEE